jgi:hypothetical protein
MIAKSFLLPGLIMMGFIVSAQHTVPDSMDSWRAQSWAYARSVDSFRIIAMSVNGDQVLLEQRMRIAGDSLNRLAGRDIKMNIRNDPRVDSLNQKLVNLNLNNMFLNERFEYRLMQIDNCMSAQNALDRKIYDAEHKK